MHLGVKIPNWGPLAGPEAIRRTAVAAEERGFDSVWVSDHIAVPGGGPMAQPVDGSSPFLDPFAALTYAAAVTERVQLGTGVLVLPLRHPVAVAKQAASVDVLSGGRLVLGVGSGWLEAEFDLLGQSFRDRGARTDEAIGVMRACWTGTPLPGELARFGTVEMPPSPGDIPVLVGGHSDPALRRAARLGDGWYASNIEAPEFARHAARVRALGGGLVGVRPGTVAPQDARSVVAAYADADFLVLDGQWSSVADAEDWVHRCADALGLGGPGGPLVRRGTPAPGAPGPRAPLPASPGVRTQPR